MTYLELVNHFWRCDLEHHLTAGDTRLYFYLLHTCNQLGWKMPFGHSDRHLALQVGISVSTARECKKRLQQRGLIGFSVPMIKSKSFEGQSQYWFPTVLNFSTDSSTVPNTDSSTVPDTDSSTVPDTVSSTVSGTVSGTVPRTNTRKDKIRIEYINNPLYPLFEKNIFFENDFKNSSDEKKTENQSAEKLIFPCLKKEKKRRKVPPKEEKETKQEEEQEYILPFSSQQFSKAWCILLEMPKWKNKQLQSLLLILKDLAKYEEKFAIYLIELAVKNDWQGVVYPDTNAKYEQWKQTNSQDGNKTVNNRTRETKSVAPETCQPERNYKERF